MDEDRGTLLAISGLLSKHLRLPAHPGRILPVSRFGHDGFASLQIQKHHYIKIPQSSCRHRLDREEIAGSQCFSMPIQEFCPQI